ncbi:MAG: hypothetical protein EAZ32_15160 [Cytophagia bacterium]|jgi:hypothetical protein|nr:MAG: hypothetical protein EAZ38_16210 [Cytophagales bacterium]TAG37499.1 MAG: hypothetical protein EAZ32_15160 [Cytophagia bacterium]TAG57755.1 MAG: hypothetical protein EAZ29_01825 [Runella slithyformis]TAG78581.1 MAG: hypothetical protein EAZ22_13355 [Cytophagales bacterium]
MKRKIIKIVSILAVVCFIQIVIIGGGQNPFVLKTDEQCLSIAKLELLNQVKLKRNMACFSFWKIEGFNREERVYKWVKTWKNRSDTIFVFAIIGRSYWGDRNSYMFGNSYTTGNEDLVSKLRITEMRDTMLPAYKFNDQELKIIEKYKDYKLCD